MSWWSSSEIEKEILKATSSSIPSGEQDLALNLEISDSVRSKQASAVEVLRVLRKRLYDRNPNVQILALHLLDLLAKNGGLHFLVELTKKDFIDAYVAQLMSLLNQDRNPEVVELMLEYFQTWALASQGKPEARYLREKYDELKRDLDFPDVGTAAEISSSFLESATAPEWTDSDTCMKSGQPFTFYNRKHHCRNCGGVFLQEYCNNFRPLPHFGINIPVRVCDDCDAKLAKKYDVDRSSDHASFVVPGSSGRGSQRKITSNNRDIGSKYQEDLDEAIRLSLEGAKRTHQAPLSAGRTARDAHEDEEEEEMDEDLKRAIASSLAEMNSGQASQPDQRANGPPSQPAHQNQQKAVQQPVGVDSEHRDTIEAFYASVQTANPREATYNPMLIELNRKSIELHPKVISELRLSSSKLATLEDLHGKLLAVANYYDALLEAELNPELPAANLPVTTAPANAPAANAPATNVSADPSNPSANLPSSPNPPTNPASSPYPPSTPQGASYNAHGAAKPDFTGHSASVHTAGYAGNANPIPDPAADKSQSIRGYAREPGHELEREHEPEQEDEPEPEPEPEPVLIEL